MLRTTLRSGMVLLLIRGGLVAFADGWPEGPDGHPATEPVLRNHADVLHERISRNVDSFSQWLDSFFGNPVVEEETYGNRVRVTTAMEIVEGEGTTLRLRVNAKLALPRMNERVQLLLSTFEDDDGQGGEPLPQEMVGEENNRQAGLRFVLREERRLRLHTDVGLKFRPAPDPYVRLRLRYLLMQEPVVVRLTESLFWFREDGVGETTRLDVEKSLRTNTFMRGTLAATWSETSQGMDLSPGVSVWRALSRRRAVGAELNVDAYTQPDWAVDRYRVTMRYRQRIWRNWLYAQIAPLVQFPEDRDYKVSPGIILQLETIFGDEPP